MPCFSAVVGHCYQPFNHSNFKSFTSFPQYVQIVACRDIKKGIQQEKENSDSIHDTNIDERILTDTTN